jgi:hypothetical protein
VEDEMSASGDMQAKLEQVDALIAQGHTLREATTPGRRERRGL